MHAYRDQYAQLFNLGQDVVLIAISTNSAEDLASWAHDDDFPFLMASDGDLQAADKYGTVCMTTPHEPYHIGPEERDQWLLCMDRALAQTGASEDVVAMLKIPLFRIADAVRNREGPSAATTDSNIIAAG